MAQIIPNIRFNDGKCREGMNFYKKCLGGGDLTFMTVKESPMAKDMPADKHDLIMHSDLKKGKLLLSGSDMMRDKATIGDNVSLIVNCESEEEIRTLFKNLSEGAEIFMELEDAYWGAIFGMLTDKYGVEWMFNYDKKK